jgi:inorganic pyrophosphatase
MWYRAAQWASAQDIPILGRQSGPAHLGSGQEVRIEAGNGNLLEVVRKFMEGSQPVFFKDANGQQYLIIHGSPAQNGEMYFDGGTSGSIRQDELGEWMRAQGYDPGATKVIACHGGQIMTLHAPGITPAFDYTGQLELAAPADGSGDFLSIRGASTRCALSKKGRGKVDVGGIQVWVDHPKGSARSGKHKDGKEWSFRMKCDYGRIMDTQGADGDAIDVFLGGDLDSDKAFVIDQLNAEGEFDEHKCVLGCNSIEEAKKLYLSNYPKYWKCGKVTEMTLKEFKKWLSKADKQKPVSDL